MSLLALPLSPHRPGSILAASASCCSPTIAPTILRPRPCLCVDAVAAAPDRDDEPCGFSGPGRGGSPWRRPPTGLPTVVMPTAPSSPPMPTAGSALTGWHAISHGLPRGADAVAGRISLEPHEAALLPTLLHARGRLEAEYEAILTEIGARLDPEPGNPWPCHWSKSGATLAVRLPAYRAVGGMPDQPNGEDRAFVDAIRARDLVVRHDPAIEIVTSGRLDGPARFAAVADTMRLRCNVPDSPCDDRLERLHAAVARSLWRRRMRRLHWDGRIAATILWAPLWEFRGRPQGVSLCCHSLGRFWRRLKKRARGLPIVPYGHRLCRARLSLVVHFYALCACSVAGCRQSRRRALPIHVWPRVTAKQVTRRPQERDPVGSTALKLVRRLISARAQLGPDLLRPSHRSRTCTRRPSCVRRSGRATGHRTPDHGPRRA